MRICIGKVTNMKEFIIMDDDEVKWLHIQHGFPKMRDRINRYKIIINV